MERTTEKECKAWEVGGEGKNRGRCHKMAPVAPAGVVGAGLMRPGFQACSLKPRVPLWLLTLHPSCLTNVCAVTERTSTGDKFAS